MNLGTFWGISAGPGDPGWLTLRGLQALQAAPIVAVPQNRCGDAGLAHTIVEQYLRPEQQVLTLALPFVQDPILLERAWQEAIERILPCLRSGQDVAFVSEGDVGLYSTFAYLARTLRRRAPEVPTRAVPGVCSPLAAAAVAGIPLALGAEKIAILPALYGGVAELERAAAWADVVVLMKVASVFGPVWSWLANRGWLEQALLVNWAGGSEQEIFATLIGLADYQPPYFSILLLRPPAQCSTEPEAPGLTPSTSL